MNRDLTEFNASNKSFLIFLLQKVSYWCSIMRSFVFRNKLSKLHRSRIHALHKVLILGQSQKNIIKRTSYLQMAATTREETINNFDKLQKDFMRDIELIYRTRYSRVSKV